MEQTFGRRLIALRTKRGLTQDELATLAGISRPHISLLEGDKKPAPQRATLHKLATALDVSESELTRTDAPKMVQPTMRLHESDDSETVRQLRRKNAEQAIIIERLWQRIDEFEGQRAKKPASADAAAELLRNQMRIAA